MNANRSQVEYHEIICYPCVNYQSSPNYILSMHSYINYKLSNYQPQIIFSLADILLVIFHEPLVIHSSNTSYPWIVYHLSTHKIEFIHSYPIGYPFICYQLFFIYKFYKCLCWILNDYHRINLSSTLVSSLCNPRKV